MRTNKSGEYLYIYYQKIIDSFQTDLAAARSEVNSEIIHELRVDIKKLRAFFTFLQLFSSGKFKAKEKINFFNELFNNAGIVRELFINHNLFEIFISPARDIDGYKKYLETEIKNSMKTFHAFVRNFKIKTIILLDAEILNLCSNLKLNVIEKKIRNFILKETDKLNKIYYHGKSEERFHKIRRHLRIQREAIDLLLLSASDSKFKLLRKKIKLKEDILGNWHDTLTLSNSLRDYLKKNLNPKNRFEKLHQIQKHVEIDKNNILINKNLVPVD